MKAIWKLTAAAALLASSNAIAASVESKLTASNGVPVTVYTDEFAGRAEYSVEAPEPKGEGIEMGFTLVSVVKRNGVKEAPYVSGIAYYGGDWRYYAIAQFKGGESVDFKRTDANVVTCRGGCTLSEGFKLTLTPAQIAKYAENGVVPIQVRATTAHTYMLEIPVNAFEALAEVSN